MDNRDIAIKAAECLDSHKALDISILDIGEKSGFADYFVICSSANARQVEALCTYVEDKLAEDAVLVHHIEGDGESGWVLMDFGDVIINVFTVEKRNHYNIDKIWNDCVKVDFEPSAL